MLLAANALDVLCPHHWTVVKSNRNKNMDDKKNSKDPLADLPCWLQDFKEILKETELHASAHSSPESDLEHPAKVATKSRKHSIYTHFPKDRNCDVCFPVQKTHW